MVLHTYWACLLNVATNIRQTLRNEKEYSCYEMETIFHPSNSVSQNTYFKIFNTNNALLPLPIFCWKHQPSPQLSWVKFALISDHLNTDKTESDIATTIALYIFPCHISFIILFICVVMAAVWLYLCVQIVKLIS